VNAQSHEIALVESATVAWTRLFYSFCQRQQKMHPVDQNKIILVSQVEYAANLVAASRYAHTHDNWTVLRLPSADGAVDLQVLQEILAGTYSLNEDDDEDGPNFLDPSTIALVCITHIPTNAGIVNPVESIGWLLQEFRATTGNDPLYLVDSCQAVGQRPVDVQAIMCDGLVATGRKYLRGPRGTGFLYCSDRLDDLWPDHVDHYGVPVSRVPTNANKLFVQDVLEFAPRPGAQRFEFWESSIANRLGLGAAVRVLNELGVDKVASKIQSLTTRLYGKLQAMDDRIHLHYKPDCGIVTFWIQGLDSSRVKEALWEEVDGRQVEVSVVPATSTPLDSAICGVPDLVRASVSYTNTMEEIDLFCERLEVILTS
jgi:selenocysteine lyase/cysteine desulfurase